MMDKRYKEKVLKDYAEFSRGKNALFEPIYSEKAIGQTMNTVYAESDEYGDIVYVKTKDGKLLYLPSLAEYEDKKKSKITEQKEIEIMHLGTKKVIVNMLKEFGEEIGYRIVPYFSRDGMEGFHLNKRDGVAPLRIPFRCKKEDVRKQRESFKKRIKTDLAAIEKANKMRATVWKIQVK